MIAAATPVPTQVHNLVLNVRSFDSIARQVWGGDAALVTLQIDTTLIRIDKARRGPNAKLAKDAISSLRTNLQLFKQVLKRISA